MINYHTTSKMDNAEIVLKDIDNSEEIVVMVKKSDLLPFDYFKNLFTFGKEPNESNFLIEVDDIYIAKDVILSLCNKNEDISTNRTARPSYPKWMYSLKTFWMRNFFLLENDIGNICKQKYPPECFDQLLSIYDHFGKDNIEVVRTIKKNIRSDYPLTKLPANLLKQMLSLSPYLLAVAGSNGVVKVWDLLTNSHVQTINSGDNISTMKLSSTGKVICICNNITVKIWDAMTGNLEKVLNSFIRPIRCFEISTDGNIIVVGDELGDIYVWKNECFKHYEQLHKITINSIAISSDNKLVASAGSIDGIKIWRIDDGNIIFSSNEKYVKNLVFSPDNKYIVCDNWTGYIIVYLITNTMFTHTLFVDYYTRINNLIFSADGNHIIFTYNNSINTWRWKVDKNFNGKINTKYAHKICTCTKIDSGLDLDSVPQSNSVDLDKLLICAAYESRIHLMDYNGGEIVHSFAGKFGKNCAVSAIGPIYSALDRKLLEHLAMNKTQITNVN